MIASGSDPSTSSLHRREERLVDGACGFGVDQHMAQEREGGLVDVGESRAKVVAAVGRRGEKDRYVDVGELGAILAWWRTSRTGHDGADPGRGQHRDDQGGPVRVRARRRGCPCLRRGRPGRAPTRRAVVGIRVAEPVGVTDQKRVCAPVRLRAAAESRRRCATQPPRMALRSGLPDGVRGI